LMTETLRLSAATDGEAIRESPSMAMADKIIFIENFLSVLLALRRAVSSVAAWHFTRQLWQPKRSNSSHAVHD
jgi:hypothetical protein